MNLNKTSVTTQHHNRQDYGLSFAGTLLCQRSTCDKQYSLERRSGSQTFAGTALRRILAPLHPCDSLSFLNMESALRCTTRDVWNVQTTSMLVTAQHVSFYCWLQSTIAVEWRTSALSKIQAALPSSNIVNQRLARQHGRQDQQASNVD